MMIRNAGSESSPIHSLSMYQSTQSILKEANIPIESQFRAELFGNLIFGFRRLKHESL